MKVLVVDDEALSRDELKYLLEPFSNIEVCGEAANGEKALEVYYYLKPEVIFLDIQMPGMGGLAVAKKLMQEKIPPTIVFATAYDKHAIKAFELNAVDYLLKPFSQERICQTVLKLEKKQCAQSYLVSRLEQLLNKMEQEIPRQESLHKFTVEDNERIKIINYADLIFAYIEGRHVFLKTSNNVYRSNLSMTALENRLPKPPFFRCHRGYIVNMSRVQEIHTWFNGTYQLILDDEENSKVSVSRLHVKEMKKLFCLK